jgi:hypothetical protein
MTAHYQPALTREGTNGRVYGGDPNLIHVPDGRRREAGRMAGKAIDFIMRQITESFPWPQRRFKLLCPGCYMVVLFNAAVWLAKQNGQPLTELGNSLGSAFLLLAANPTDEGIEEIEVQLDPCD